MLEESAWEESSGYGLGFFFFGGEPTSVAGVSFESINEKQTPCNCTIN